MTITTCIFDAYGTLFDVNAAARAVAAEPGQAGFADVWQEVAAHWRAKQLQYTWIRALTGHHTDFWQITQDALDWALERTGQGDPDLRERLLGLYFTLEAYPEVPEMLAKLKAQGLNTAILSNGAPEMLKGAVDSADLAALLDDVLSVESVGIFKPDASVYKLVGERFGCRPGEVLFVSANGWDAASARAFGFRVLWVNRAGEPRDRLPDPPDRIADDLTPVPAIVRDF